jgi:arabinose-5-phosphate isomerase
MALEVMRLRDFTPEQFAAFHPGGSLGRGLMKVEEAMTFRAGDRLAVASDRLRLGEALAEGEKTPRRAGALLLTDADGRLSGIVTDGDLRRALLAHDRAELLDMPVAEVMIRDPKRIALGELASEALAIFNEHRIDELPVVDADGRPVGIIDVQDLVALRTVSDGRD